MARVTQSVKNMTSGISQQPVNLRYPEQLEAQINALSNGPQGLQKRPPTVHVANLPDTFMDLTKDPSGLFTHTIDRDSSEQYHVVFDGVGISITDRYTGAVKTVNYEGSAQSYIQTPTPLGILKAVTIADYTFIVNTSKKIAMTSAKTSAAWDTQGALINVKSGQYGRTYQVLIDDVVKASYQTPTGANAADVTSIDTNFIATQLYNGLVASGYTCTKGESWVYIQQAGITKLGTRDGFNNSALFGFLKATQKFSNLPLNAPDGFTVLVKGNNENSTDDYYVKYVASSEVWEECAKPGLTCEYDPATMPHILVREADGTFTFSAANWDQRDVGDDDSNPQASFVGKTIKDVFFVRNRLGLLAGENCIQSKTGEFFKFWMTTATDVLDSDMIDQAVPDESVANLHHATVFGEELVMFSDKAQFVGHSDTVFSPKAFRIDKATSFDSLPTCKPYSAGRRVYFANQRAKESSLMEYYVVEDVSSVRDAIDVSGHVPKFLPNTIIEVLGSNSENIILMRSSANMNRLYVYRYLWQKEVRVLASWSYWNFGSATIITAAFFGSTLSLLVKRNGHLSLEKMIFTVNTTDLSAEDYRVFLDRKVTYTVPTATFDPLTYQTTINLHLVYGRTLQDGYKYGVVFPDGNYAVRTVTSGNANLVVNGNREGELCVVGEVLHWENQLSEIMYKADDGKGGIIAKNTGTLQLQKLSLNHNESGYYQVEVSQKGKKTFVYPMTARILGDSNNIINEPAFDTGSHNVPIMGNSKDVEIKIISEAPYQVSLVGFQWWGNKTDGGGGRV